MIQKVARNAERSEKEITTENSTNPKSSSAAKTIVHGCWVIAAINSPIGGPSDRVQLNSAIKRTKDRMTIALEMLTRVPFSVKKGSLFASRWFENHYPKEAGLPLDSKSVALRQESVRLANQLDRFVAVAGT